MRARSEQRSLESFTSHNFNYDNKDRNFANSQNRSSYEKKARDMFKLYMNKYVKH